MGKGEQNLLQLQRLEIGNRGGSSRVIFCERCRVGLSRISKELSFKCVFLLILSLCLLVFGIFWIFPIHTVNINGFDAKDDIKLNATVQAYFRLQNPVSQLVPHIGRLEYDINGEIGIPGAKVAILSMHQPGAANWTDVVFGVLPDPINVPINLMYLSVLRSSLLDLFLQQSNLTLTTSIFGQPSMFEILKFPGGVTIIPMQYAAIWQIPQMLFNFTLNNSISVVLENFIELKDQLEFGLHLRPYEYVFVQITNAIGSTETPPVTVQASVMSNLGILLPQRLQQLAQTITDSPAKNLGLDDLLFGHVKSVVLSSYLEGTIHAIPPTPSPAPSPELSISPSPAFSPAPSPSDYGNPCATSPKSGHHHSFPPVKSPAPSMVTDHPSYLSPDCDSAIPPGTSHHLRPVGPPSQLPPDLSPLPEVSFGSNPGKDSASPSLAPSKQALSPSSLAVGPSYREILLLGFYGLFIFHLLCWQH